MKRAPRARSRFLHIWLPLLIVLSLLVPLVPTGVTASAPALAYPAAGRLTAPHATDDDAYSCTDVTSIAGVRSASLQRYAFSGAEAWMWLRFHVDAGRRYQLNVGHTTGLTVDVRDDCNAAANTIPLAKEKMRFTATRTGDYYMLVRRNDAEAAGIDLALAPLAPHRKSFTAAAEVPNEVARRAADFLEEIKGGDLAPEWAEARVNPEARILYRPDMTEPAYYEFTVEKPTDLGFEPAGFIQLAAGEHDYPVTHWDVTGMSPTQELQELAPVSQVEVTEFFKLDALSYVAEYETFTPLGLKVEADDVLNIGDIPGRIDGLEGIPAEAAELAGDSLDSDDNAEHEGPEELPLTEQKDWNSWEELKTEYKSEYGPLLDSLKQRASDPWTLDQNLSEYGESLVKGDVRTVMSLPAQTIASIAVSGDGADAQYLEQAEIKDGETLTGLQLTVVGEPEDAQTRLPVEVTVAYAGGESEVIKYAIVRASDLNVNQLYLPFLTATQNQVAAADSSATNGSWGPWRYWWADGDAGSIRYGQMSANSGVNTSGCASGCGGTSWAMLFAWVDRRAAENHARWRNHWGLYRTNGGTGSNATAPLSQDAGVRNMTWEIRNRIGTFCIFGSGATWPWNMIDASNYVRPRATASWRMRTKYDPTGLCWFGACNGNRDLAKDAIVNLRQPAVVGTGWLKHYPMAYGYAERSKRSCFLWICSTSYSRWFYVNNGWYGNNNGWTSADVWFAGTYYAQ